MKTLVVIPNWNGRDFIGEALRSLASQPADVVVVENGSTDGSVEYLEREFPNVFLLKQPRNLGFAAGVNVGIRYALEHHYKYVALFNNDAVASKGWLRALIKAAETRPRVGIVTGKLMLMDKVHLDSSGEFYTTRGMPFSRGRNEVDSGQYDKAEEVFAATGGASLYRTKLLRKIGLFDEDFFAYFEDVDLSFRARLAGWMVWYEPLAVAYHRVSATSSRLGKQFSYYHSIKNFILLYDRDMPASLYLKYKPYFLYQYARMFAGSFKHGLTLTFLRATFVSFLLQPKTILLHIRRHRRRRVEPKVIEAWLIKQRPPQPPELESPRHG